MKKVSNYIIKNYKIFNYVSSIVDKQKQKYFFSMQTPDI